MPPRQTPPDSPSNRERSSNSPAPSAEGSGDSSEQNDADQRRGLERSSLERPNLAPLKPAAASSIHLLKSAPAGIQTITAEIGTSEVAGEPAVEIPNTQVPRPGGGIGWEHAFRPAPEKPAATPPPRPRVADPIASEAPGVLVAGFQGVAEQVGWQAPELAVVVPTYNERDNISALVGLLENTLVGTRFEVVIVDDDSPDGTADVARDLALTRPWVRVIQRVGRKGLASACLEGMLSTTAPAIAVMDADLQHDETILPVMLNRLREWECDVVVGTRNLGGGSKGEMDGWRVKLSDWGLRVSRLVMGSDISDPMSGFFMLDRRFLHEVVRGTSGVGFKILVDLLASAKRPLRSAEVPYVFRQREHGASKLDLNVGLEYLYLLLDKLIGEWVPVRFALYAGIGAVGVALHLGILSAVLSGGASFLRAQMVATAVAMTANFFLNNIVTHRDVKLRGWRLLPGLATFYIACSVGFLTNLSVSETLLQAGIPALWAGFAGLIVTSVWNYGVTSLWTWRRMKDRAAERR